jgi:Uncharacterized membrane-associated protein
MAHFWNFITYSVDVFLHLDKYLGAVIQNFGHFTYLILFVIIFCETGLVVTPFLPGDSLLFAIGTFAGMGYLDIKLCFIVLCAAAVLGDSANYSIGRYIGPKVFSYKNSRIFKKEYLEKTHRFYEKYGGKTIIIARFVPIVRTFAPFVAGVGSMTYARFISYNFVGGVLWVSVIVFAGYFFGNIPAVKNNFSMVIMAIIVISVLPAVIEYIRQRGRSGGRTPDGAAAE